MSDDVILTNKDARKSLKRLEKDIHKNRLLNKRPRVEPPRRVLLEEIGCAVSHGIGAVLSIIGLVFLLIKSTTPLMRVAAIIYMASMFLMCLNSCLYHSWKWGRKVKRIWRRFDYTSIYLQIAGTFAPIQLILLGRVYGQTGQIIGYLYFGLMWAAFITGIVLTCVFGPENVRKVNFPLYFVGGWSALLMVPGWIQYDWHFAMWIFIGGAVYSLGMIPFGLLRRKPGAHFWWHIFVLAGVILHFYAIYQFIFSA